MAERVLLPTKKVVIASDHAGIHLKKGIIEILSHLKWEDLGPHQPDRVDYPDYAVKLTDQIAHGRAEVGILICGSGIGMSIAANKIQGIRAALVENPIAARLSREHNDANVLCLGARFLAPEYAAEITEIWLKTEFSGDARHLGRIEKIAQLETQHSPKINERI